jgi:hypothetical protein
MFSRAPNARRRPHYAFSAHSAVSAKVVKAAKAAKSIPAAAAMFAVLALTNCSYVSLEGKPDASGPMDAMVRIPAADPTPPSAALDVIGRDTSIMLAMGMDPEAVALSPDDSLVLVAIGEDFDGGVKDLTLVGDAMVSCEDPLTGKLTSRATGFRRARVGGGAARYEAEGRKTSRFVLRPRDFAALCPGGGIRGVVGQASVRTLNFHGGNATSPRLEFRLSEEGAKSLASRSPSTVTQGIQYRAGSPGSGGSGGARPEINCPLSDTPDSLARAGKAGSTPAQSPKDPSHPYDPSRECRESPEVIKPPGAPAGESKTPAAHPASTPINPKTPSNPSGKEPRI